MTERTVTTYEITGPCKHCGVRVKRMRFGMTPRGQEYGPAMYAGPPTVEAPPCYHDGRQGHQLDVIDFNDPASVEAWLADA